MTDNLTPYQKKILKKMADGGEPETYSMGPWTRAYRFGNAKEGLNSKTLWNMQKQGLIEHKTKMTEWGLRNYYVITAEGRKALKE